MTVAAQRGQMRWWYASIADWMLRNPGSKLEECAKFFNKHPNTISLIINSDVFKAYLAQRRREWQLDHDAQLTQRLGDVAMKSMDCILEQIDKKRDTLRLDVLTELMGSSLEKLGFGKPNAPTVQVNTMVDASTQQIAIAVSPETLREAREALRIAESRRGGGGQDILLAPSAEATTSRAGTQDVLGIEKSEE